MFIGSICFRQMCLFCSFEKVTKVLSLNILKTTGYVHSVYQDGHIWYRKTLYFYLSSLLLRDDLLKSARVLIILTDLRHNLHLILKYLRMHITDILFTEAKK